jgi:ADP-heptose:LPS heptosyltransferase
MIGMIRFVDNTFFAFLCWLIGLFKIKQNKPKNVRNSCVVRLWAIGESICTLPLVAETNSDVLCSGRNKDVFKGYATIGLNPLKILFMFNKYNVVYDTEQNLNFTAIISWWIGRHVVGFDTRSKHYLYDEVIHYNDSCPVQELYYSMYSKKLTKINLVPVKPEHLEYIPKQPFIVLGCTTAESAKFRGWPYFKRLVESVPQKLFVVVCSARDIDEVKVMFEGCENVEYFSGTINEAAFLAEKADFAVCNDSGVMHLCSAMGVKTIGLFGPNLPIRFGAYNWKNCYHRRHCSPCIQTHLGKFPPCPYMVDGVAPCMGDISVSEVKSLISN